MGAFPGYFWNAPTYVTELVGYLYRRNRTAFVCVFPLKFLWGRPRPCPPFGQRVACPTGICSRDRLFIPHPSRRSPDRGQRVFCRRRGVATFGPSLAPAPTRGR